MTAASRGQPSGLLSTIRHSNVSSVIGRRAAGLLLSITVVLFHSSSTSSGGDLDFLSISGSHKLKHPGLHRQRSLNTLLEI